MCKCILHVNVVNNKISNNKMKLHVSNILGNQSEIIAFKICI